MVSGEPGFFNFADLSSAHILGEELQWPQGVQDRPLSRLDYQPSKAGQCQSLRGHKWLTLTACEFVFCNLIANQHQE